MTKSVFTNPFLDLVTKTTIASILKSPKRWLKVCLLTLFGFSDVRLLLPACDRQTVAQQLLSDSTDQTTRGLKYNSRMRENITSHYIMTITHTDCSWLIVTKYKNCNCTEITTKSAFTNPFRTVLVTFIGDFSISPPPPPPPPPHTHTHTHIFLMWKVVGWGCALNCFMLSSLLCSLLLLICYPYTLLHF